VPLLATAVPERETRDRVNAILLISGRYDSRRPLRATEINSDSTPLEAAGGGTRSGEAVLVASVTASTASRGVLALATHLVLDEPPCLRPVHSECAYRTDGAPLTRSDTGIAEQGGGGD
jgi:hypothetical protein